MKRTWQVGNILSLLAALTANFLFGAQLVGLPGIDEISDKYATLLTPADYAFGIWLLIYLALVIFVVYQARDIIKVRKGNDLPEKIGPYFIIANICNGLWTYVFVSELIGLSVIILLTLTMSLYVMILRLRMAINNAPLSVIVCVWWPLLLYTGWVTVASVVNIASWLNSLGIMISPVVACLALIALAICLTVLLVKRNVRELLLASIWGIIAIGVRQLQIADGGVVAIVAFVVAGLLLAGVVIHAYKNRKSTPFYS